MPEQAIGATSRLQGVVGRTTGPHRLTKVVPGRGAVKRPILHQGTKFRKDRSNRCGDITIFVIFKMAAAAILNFQKFKILTVDPL